MAPASSATRTSHELPTLEPGGRPIPPGEDSSQGKLLEPSHRARDVPRPQWHSIEERQCRLARNRLVDGSARITRERRIRALREGAAIQSRCTSSTQPTGVFMLVNRLQAAARSRGRLHAHRAARRHRHHRDPARDRSPVVPRLQGSRQQTRRVGRRPRRRSRRPRRTTPTRRRQLRRHEPRGAASGYDRASRHRRRRRHAHTAPANDTYCLEKTVSGKTSSVTRGAAPLNDGVVPGRTLQLRVSG